MWLLVGHFIVSTILAAAAFWFLMDYLSSDDDLG
jgi:hypothetical protein